MEPRGVHPLPSVMTIGAIIPTYNEERTLPRTLLYARQRQLDQIVLVDGGSQDHTVSVAQSHFRGVDEQVAKMLSSPQGRARQMNAGAAACSTDILLFLHADTLLPDDARTAIEQAMANPQYVGGRFDVQFEEDRGYAWLISRMMNLRSRWSGIATGDHAIFVRRSAFEKLGGFADIPLMEDVEFMHRLKALGGIAPLRSKVTTSFRRWDQNGPLRTILQMWGLRFLYWAGISPQTLHRFYGTIR